MHAIHYDRYGPPEVLTRVELPDPSPNEGELLIRTGAVGMSFADVQRRQGQIARLGWAGELSAPVLPGEELAGTVVDVGAGVDRSIVGRRVAGITRAGSYAELGTVPVGSAALVPDGLSDQEAVALVVSGSVARQLIEVAGIEGGETVLVQSAGGAIGTLLTQFLRRAGVGRIVATARGPHKLDLAGRLGADITVDYTEQGWTERVREQLGGADVDIIFESAGGSLAREALDLLAVGVGRMMWFGISCGEWPMIEPADLHWRSVGLMSFRFRAQAVFQEVRPMNAEVLQAAASGDVAPVLGTVLSLWEVARAHEAAESRRTVGKTVLTP